MKNSQKMGGVAALYGAAAYLIAMVGYVLVLGTLGDFDPVEKVASLVDNQAFLYTLNLISYVVFGLFLVVLALALYERLKAGSPALAQTATAIGLIWATVVIGSGMIQNYGMGIVVDLYGTDPTQAATVWLAVDSVTQGLGGASGEILGGPWVLLVSWAALRAGELPKALNYLGLVLGVAGILSIIPALFLMLALVFGMGKIVWLIWLGIVMLRSSPSTVATSVAA
jgi:hypothetical protein